MSTTALIAPSNSAVAAMTAEVDTSKAVVALDLYCPFPSAVHADVVRLNARTVTWAMEMGLIKTEKQARRLRAAQMGSLVARAFPEGRVEAVQLAADWTTLFCLLDDRIEEIENPLKVTSYLNGLLEVYRGEGKLAEQEDPGARALADLRERMKALGSARKVERFGARLQQLFACFSAEARNRSTHTVPQPEEYLGLRQVTVGLYAEFEFWELAEGVELPDEVREHPLVKQMADRACNVVGWANDFFTYEKEIQAGEVHNLVMVLMRHRGLPLQFAAGKAVEMHNEEVKSFILDAEAMPSFGPEMDELVGKYTGMLVSWMRGHMDWADETGRYMPNPQARQEASAIAA